MNGQVTWRVILTLEEARVNLPEITEDTIFPIVVLIFDDTQAFIMDRTLFLSVYQAYMSQLILFHDIGINQNTILPPQEISNDRS